ncbi:hypothetical protein J5N97_009746 [Dioscorea zingiberensis]|uniref:Uncharacterized protein n=1 Tax=Dioscorea zingiberensis TaxID=325984 RepID=A0A9D5CXR5_9LILI|nr:hypothetical protein J5N97_009746 [Dioscorea zingiberensis]
MACINMYSSGQEQPQGGGGGGGGGGIPNISPRISFSSDFILEKPGPSSAPPSQPQLGDPDFEFAVGTRPMMAADELIFKGRLLPLRETCSAPRPSATTTLRDELRAGADDAWEAPPRHNKPGLPKWKGFLGLKKTGHGGGHYGAKKQLVYDHKSTSDQACASGRKSSSSTQQGILEEEEEEEEDH